MAVKDMLEQEIPRRLAAKPELGRDIGAVVHFKISGDGGGEWTLDCTSSEPQMTLGITGASKMTIYAAAPDFERILSKQMNPQMAAMAGKLKFKPMDMTLAMKLAKLLG